MQFHNFYSDPVPSVRSPLDSIVLSPHTIKSNDFSLSDLFEDPGDYQSLLPSLSRCEYHDQHTGMEANSLPRLIWDRSRQLIRRYGQRNAIKQAR